MRDDDAGALAEQLDRMRERRRDDRLRRRDRLDEHAGDDLVAREVRKQDEIGLADLGQDPGRVAIAVLELDQGLDAARSARRLQRLAVGLAGIAHDVRVRLAEHDVTGCGPEVAELARRRRLRTRSLAGAEEAPGEDHRAP